MDSKDANYSGADFSFLKYPHVVDRRLEWFQLQVRSGTLHTEEVVRCLYNTGTEPSMCVWCNKEPESVLHCLIRCSRAVYARRCLALIVSKELTSMGVSCIDIWFDNVRLKDGKALWYRNRYIRSMDLEAKGGPKAAPGPDKVLSRPTLTVSAAVACPANKTAAAIATLPRVRNRTIMVCPVEKSKPNE